MKLESAVFLAGAAMLAALSPAARADCVVPCLDNACGSSASKICCTYLPIFSGFPTQTPRSPSHTDMHQHIRNVARVATPPPPDHSACSRLAFKRICNSHTSAFKSRRAYSAKKYFRTQNLYTIYFIFPRLLCEEK